MFVAPASSAFSNSSLTAVARSKITCPLAMRCTAAAGTGAMCPDIILGMFLQSKVNLTPAFSPCWAMCQRIRATLGSVGNISALGQTQNG